MANWDPAFSDRSRSRNSLRVGSANALGVSSLAVVRVPREGIPCHGWGSRYSLREKLLNDCGVRTNYYLNDWAPAN